MKALFKGVCVALVAAALVSSGGPASAQGFLEKLQKSTGDLGKSLGLGGGSGAGALSTADIASGLREALKVGTERLTTRLGAANGFNADPAVHIPLPESLQKVQSTLRRFGLSGMANDLETRLNRAAEAAVPKGKKLFWDAIQRMTLDDARGILNGPKDSATRYFEGGMTTPLKAEFKPIVDTSLNEVGAIRSYDSLMGRYKSLPFVPDVKADLTNHVLDKAVAGASTISRRKKRRSAKIQPRGRRIF
jgi:hypothetical protein